MYVERFFEHAKRTPDVDVTVNFYVTPRCANKTKRSTARMSPDPFPLVGGETNPYLVSLLPTIISFDHKSLSKPQKSVVIPL